MSALLSRSRPTSALLSRSRPTADAAPARVAAHALCMSAAAEPGVIRDAVFAGETDSMPEGASLDNLVVVCGFGELGQTVANMLEVRSPFPAPPTMQRRPGRLTSCCAARLRRGFRRVSPPPCIHGGGVVPVCPGAVW